MNMSAINNLRDVKTKDIDGNQVLGTVDLGSFQVPPLADAITVEYPSPTVEIYRYRQGGLTGVILRSVTITYLTSSKRDLSSAEVS